MAIIDVLNRPAINIIQDSYTSSPGLWDARLGDAGIRNRLQTAISGVGRLDFVGEPHMTFGGTAFVVGPDLLMSQAIGPVIKRDGDTYSFRPGMSAMVDFKRELIPTEPVYVKIEEVLYVDSRCGVELLRAKLPGNITPLRFLSVILKI